MIKIRLTGEFKENGEGLLEPGQVTIKTKKGRSNFLHNKANYNWLRSVINKFRTGAGGDPGEV